MGRLANPHSRGVSYTLLRYHFHGLVIVCHSDHPNCKLQGRGKGKGGATPWPNGQVLSYREAGSTSLLQSKHAPKPFAAYRL